MCTIQKQNLCIRVCFDLFFQCVSKGSAADGLAGSDPTPPSQSQHGTFLSRCWDSQISLRERWMKAVMVRQKTSCDFFVLALVQTNSLITRIPLLTSLPQGLEPAGQPHPCSRKYLQWLLPAQALQPSVLVVITYGRAEGRSLGSSDQQLCSPVGHPG